jgi:hypothetical protein
MRRKISESKELTRFGLVPNHEHLSLEEMWVGKGSLWKTLEVECVDNEGVENLFEVGIRYKVLSKVEDEVVMVVEDMNGDECLAQTYRFKKV